MNFEGTWRSPFFEEHKVKLARALMLVCLLMPVGVNAEITPGDKQVWFESANGERVKLGNLELKPDADGWRFRFELEDSGFSQQFLSMRPFKCLDGETMFCRLAYLYTRSNRITAQNFRNLEYEFLFITRSPKEYGIDPYNGRYYLLSEQDGRLIGEPRAVDLNILAAPPDPGVDYPITEAELDYIEVELERFVRLVIE